MRRLDDLVENTFSVVGYPGDIGLELEIEGKFPEFGALGSWRSEPEGSLRNGVELVLREPCKIEEVPDRIDEYKKIMRKCTLKPSIRTSVHMHINAQKETFRSIFSFLMVYWLVENILVRMQGSNREGNLHCLRLSDAKGIYSLIASGLRSGQIFSNEFLSSDQRYSALNFSALRKFGSIEFRFMKFPDDIDDIKVWVSELWNLWNTAKSLKPQEILRLMDLPAETILNQFFSHNFVNRIVQAIPREVLQSFVNEHSLYLIMLNEDLNVADNIMGDDQDDIQDQEFDPFPAIPEPDEEF